MAHHLLPRKLRKPPLGILRNRILYSALIHIGNRLRLQHPRHPRTTTAVKHARAVERALQRVALPAKDVVGVGAVPLIVHERPDKRLLGGKGPVGVAGPQVFEGARVPHGLVRQLRHLDGVRRGALGPVEEAALAFGFGAEHVGLVVRAVEVHAIPAGREVVDRHDARGAGV